MRRIVTAISAAALALSFVAQAVPAAAATPGFDSSYAGESAFLNLSRGQQGTFTVFFANTGTTSWVGGTGTQVDLAACLEDKVTCSAQDASEAPFNDGWLSTTRYATHTQTTVAPGQIGTFTYNVKVPTDAAAATYRFNGDLVVSLTGDRIHPEGYFQDVTVAVTGAAPTLTTLTPTSGSLAGGTSVTITGTGFTCTPAFPVADFGGTAATSTGCSATQLTVTTPAHAAGAVNVTVSNQGSGPSNALSFTYRDTTAPTYDSVVVESGRATLTFSEIICENAAFALGADFAVTINGAAAAVGGETLAACDPVAAPHSVNTQTTFILTFTPAAVGGDFVAVTITATGAAKIEDVTGNKMAAAQTRTATATADTTKPSISSAAMRTGLTTIRLTYSERVRCAAGGAATAPQFSITSSSGTPATQAATGTNCATTVTGQTSIDITFATAFANNIGGTVTYTGGADPVLDLAGNTASSPQTIAFAGFTADTTGPTMLDTRLTSGGFASLLDAGDIVRIGFSEDMDTSTPANIRIRVQDADGTVADVNCAVNATCAWNGADVTMGGVTYTPGQLLTVTLTADPTVVTGFAGSTAGVQIPATIIDTANLRDVAGNAVNVSGSADRVIDVE